VKRKRQILVGLWYVWPVSFPMVITEQGKIKNVGFYGGNPDLKSPILDNNFLVSSSVYY
jgi:hypothetical protein